MLLMSQMKINCVLRISQTLDMQFRLSGWIKDSLKQGWEMQPRLKPVFLTAVLRQLNLYLPIRSIWRMWVQALQSTAF